MVEQVMNSFLKRLDSEEMKRGPLTGLSQIDHLLGGLSPGLHVIAGRCHMRKATLMLNIVEHLSTDQRLPCLIFSGELSAHQIVTRMIYSRARLAPASTFGRNYSPDTPETMQLKKAAAEIANSCLFIEDHFDYFIDALRSIAVRYKQEQNIGFIAIDHLHLLRSKSPRALRSHKLELTEIVADLKSLAHELKVPILLLAELKAKVRGGRHFPFGYPHLSDLRHHKVIKKYADTLALLYRPSYYVKIQR